MAILDNQFEKQNLLVLTEKFEASILICEETIGKKSVSFSSFMEVHNTKVQGLCRNKGVVNFDLQTQESRGSGQIYPALSRVRNYLKYFFLEKYSSE